MAHAAPEPSPGDLVVSLHDGDQVYWVVEHGSGVRVAGPFARDSYAIGVAESLAIGRRVSVWLGRDGILAPFSAT